MTHSTSASRASPSESRTGRPARAECASDPSRWTSPWPASSISTGEAGPSAIRAAVTWISAFRSTSASSRSRKSAPAWRSGCAITQRKPRSVERVHGVDQIAGDRAGPRLDQQPHAGPPERDVAQLLVRHLVQGLVRDLAAWGDAHLHALPLELAVHRLDAALELVHLHVVVGADMRGRAYDLDPVGLGLAGHRDAVLEIDRAVVECGEDVAVKVDHGSLLTPRANV